MHIYTPRLLHACLFCFLSLLKFDRINKIIIIIIIIILLEIYIVNTHLYLYYVYIYIYVHDDVSANACARAALKRGRHTSE